VSEPAADRWPRGRAVLTARTARWLGWAALAIILAALPLYLTPYWEQAGLFAMAAIIGAAGLTVLTGTTGQLSLAHAFFLAIGAYGYAYLAAHHTTIGVSVQTGLGWPPVLAAIGAVAIAGAAGAAFSTISSRLRGIYLGIASLGLVFIGQQVLFNATTLTGGYNGRDVPPFAIAGFQFADSHPALTILGVPYGQLERLWYLGLALVVLACWYARNLVKGRPGRALEAVRDGEISAAVMGVNVRRYKAAAFTISSMYAGLAGVLFALTVGQVVPNSFDFTLSISYVVMIVIGGPGSIGGAVLGAIFVSVLPQVLDQYSGSLPLISPTGSGGFDAALASDMLYGLAVIAVLVFAPAGLAGLGERTRNRFARHVITTPQASAPASPERKTIP
jgi:branched-chain amino acid transport system permease protein